MGDDSVRALVEALDQVWSHRWESLLALLEGVDDDEAGWAATCYDEVVSSGALCPRPGSVHWHVNHLAGCKLNYISEVRHAVDPANPRRGADALDPCSEFSAERDRLGEIHREFRDLVASLEDEDLGRGLADGTLLLEFIVSCTRHDAWHGGQIAIARRLYRTRG